MIYYFFLLFILLSPSIIYADSQNIDDNEKANIEEPGSDYTDPENHDTEHSIIDDSPIEEDVELGQYWDEATPFIMSRFVGTFIGFGLGHLIQGRWLQTGWMYTIAGIVTLPVISDPWPLYGRDEHYKKGLSAYLVVKALEIYDVWSFDESNSKVAIKPVSFFHQDKRHYGFALSSMF